MTATRLRILTGVFLVMTFGVSFNLIALQPQDGSAVLSALQADPAEVSPSHESAIQGLTTLPKPSVVSTAHKAVVRELIHRGYLDTSDASAANEKRARAAIFAFEYDHGMPLTAEATSDLLEALIIGMPRAPGTSPMADKATAAYELVLDVQTSLKKLGFSPGSPDGWLGPRTTRAIELFEVQHGFPATGRISAHFVTQLERSLSGSAAGTGTRQSVRVQAIR